MTEWSARSTGWEWLSLTERLESVWQTATRSLTPINGSVSVKPPVISSRCTSHPVFSTGETNRERLSEPITYTQSRFDTYKEKAPEPQATITIHHNLLHALKPCTACFLVCFVNINHFAHATHSVVCKRLKKGTMWQCIGSGWFKPRVIQIICRSCFTSFLNARTRL